MTVDPNDEGSEGYKKLEHIAARLDSGDCVEPITVRELLRWFGAERRGVRTNEMIRDALLKNNLRIEPDLNAQVLNGEIQFHNDSTAEAVVHSELRFELFTLRLAAWIDENPDATESDIRAKSREMKEFGFGDLSKDEIEDIGRLHGSGWLLGEQNETALEGYEKLQWIGESLKRGEGVAPVTVRELLRWFGTNRRRLLNNYMIRIALRRNSLHTEPDFNSQFLDGPITFLEGYKATEFDVSILNQIYQQLLCDRLADWVDQHPGATNDDIRAKDEELQKLELYELGSYDSADIIPFPGRDTFSTPGILPLAVDPTMRIRDLDSAKNAPTCVSPTTSVREAMTIMLLNNFSLLPVINGKPKVSNVKGVISWHSIGEQYAMGAKCTEVRQCMKKPQLIDGNEALATAIDLILEHEYALVYDGSRTISGIVTTYDLGKQFRELSEPFLLLEEIETHIRVLISRAGFTVDELRDAVNPNDAERKAKVNGIYDLTFGEYTRLFGRNGWSKLGLPIDRKTLIGELENIGRIRNDVMHFSPDPVSPNDIQTLRNLVSFLRRVRAYRLHNGTDVSDSC